MLMPLIFIGVVIYGCVFVIRRAQPPQAATGLHRPSPLTRPAPEPQTSVAPLSAADSGWTALDEHQLTRLLSDAAPPPAADDRSTQPVEPPSEGR